MDATGNRGNRACDAARPRRMDAAARPRNLEIRLMINTSAGARALRKRSRRVECMSSHSAFCTCGGRSRLRLATCMRSSRHFSPSNRCLSSDGFLSADWLSSEELLLSSFAMASCPKTSRPVVTASLSRALLDVLKDYATGGYRPGLADAAVESGLQVGAYHSAKQALDRLVARLKVDEDGDVEERVSGKKIVAREDWQRVVLE